MVQTLLKASLRGEAWVMRSVSGSYWTEFLRALAEVEPDMAVNIEHEDADYSRLDGLALAAENLCAAAAKM